MSQQNESATERLKQAQHALEQQRAERASSAARLAELEQAKEAAADDPKRFAAAASAVQTAQLALERSSLLVRRAEDDVQASAAAAQAEQRARKEAELAELERELRETVSSIQTRADAYAQSMRATWEAKRAVDEQTARASDIQARAKELATRLGKTAELEERDLGKYARAAALVALEQHREHAVELGDWTAVYPESDRLLSEVQRSLGLWRHIGDAPYPMAEQLADMLSYRAERWHARAVTGEARARAEDKERAERIRAAEAYGGIDPEVWHRQEAERNGQARPIEPRTDLGEWRPDWPGARAL